MSDLTLGLDLGPNSIGWALIDEPNQRIVATGARVFPEGVDRDQQGGEQSKSQTRRDARGMRRQIARRAHRRKQLRKALTSIDLLPSDPKQIAKLFDENPYELRRRALDEKLTAHQLGRVLFHLAQRRGFLSNRKTDKKKDDTKGLLAEISELASEIKEQGHRTLGEHLADRMETSNHRIRGQHTRRDMYEAEFDAIWESQRSHYPDLLTDKLKYGTRGKQTYPKAPQGRTHEENPLAEFGLHGLIFFQRKIYWPRSVVGRCELEPKHKRCPRADRAAQRFRILQEVNNLRLLDRMTGDERRLKDEERAKLLEYISGARQRTFDQIRKKLGFLESVQFNLERGERDKLLGHVTDAALSAKKAFGKKRWNEFSEETKDSIVDVLLEEDQEDEAIRKLIEDCGVTHDEAERALAVNLPDGHTNFSKIVIEKLLPHLERGMLLMGDDPTDSALHAAGYLRPDEREVGQKDFLPPSPDLPNPIVRQALVEVRRVVNAIIREHGRPARIHIELAREAKKSFEARREIRFDNAKRRRLREEATTEIEKVGAKPTPPAIKQYLLWNEQGRMCIYSGESISIARLFSGEVNIDHILPRWRSLDDSMANKVICLRSENEAKGDRTPREWLEDSDPEKFERIIQASKRLPYNKQRKIQRKDIELSEFVERQLRDTAYISRCVTQYLRCLGAHIVCSRGQMTADLRHWWGLNNILDPEKRGRKMREDHRHHAIDAIVIAMTNPKRLHALANAHGDNMPAPWGDFFEDAKKAVRQINVSHRVQRRISGALHEATLYGPTDKTPARTEDSSWSARPWAKRWVENQHTYVRRKAVTDLTNTKHVAKVRDEKIREILREHLRSRGIDPDKPGKIPGDAFKGDNTPQMPSGVPIKRVRMLEESETFRRVSQKRNHQYVKPGNNHHVIYRATGEGEREKWTAEVVTMWDAALLARRGLPPVDRSDHNGQRFVLSLTLGEMFQIDGQDGERLLCVVRKMDQRSKRLNYKLHTDAREAAKINKDNLYISQDRMRKLHARKVTVDPLGRIRWAND